MWYISSAHSPDQNNPKRLDLSLKSKAHAPMQHGVIETAKRRRAIVRLHRCKAYNEKSRMGDVEGSEVFFKIKLFYFWIL